MVLLVLLLCPLHGLHICSSLASAGRVWPYSTTLLILDLSVFPSLLLSQPHAFCLPKIFANVFLSLCHLRISKEIFYTWLFPLFPLPFPWNHHILLMYSHQKCIFWLMTLKYLILLWICSSKNHFKYPYPTFCNWKNGCDVMFFSFSLIGTQENRNRIGRYCTHNVQNWYYTLLH